MMDSFDVLLVDLQDLGCRIYTFITTLRYVLEEAAHYVQPIRPAPKAEAQRKSPALTPDRRARPGRFFGTKLRPPTSGRGPDAVKSMNISLGVCINHAKEQVYPSRLARFQTHLSSKWRAVHFGDNQRFA